MIEVNVSGPSAYNHLDKLTLAGNSASLQCAEFPSSVKCWIDWLVGNYIYLHFSIFGVHNHTQINIKLWGH